MQQHHHRATATLAHGQAGTIGERHQALGKALGQTRLERRALAGIKGLLHVHTSPQRLMLASGWSAG
ncbi:hypothetical protein D3C84_1137570 [compost metagenome]